MVSQLPGRVSKDHQDHYGYQKLIVVEKNEKPLFSKTENRNRPKKNETDPIPNTNPSMHACQSTARAEIFSARGPSARLHVGPAVYTFSFRGPARYGPSRSWPSPFTVFLRPLRPAGRGHSLQRKLSDRGIRML